MTDESQARSPHAEEAECPMCGEPPVEPYEVQFEGPGVELVCLNDHHFMFFGESGETRMVGL